MRDPYEVLGVSRAAGAWQIKAAFRKRSKATHPDHGGNPEEFAAVVEAYDILRDPEKRAAYDRGEYDPRKSEGPPPIEVRARGMMRDMVTYLLEGAIKLNDSGAFRRRSLIKALEDEIYQVRSMVAMDRAKAVDAAKVVDALKDVRRRVRRKAAAKDDPVLDAIDATIAQRQTMAESMMADVKAREELLAEVVRQFKTGSWEYEVDKPNAPTPPKWEDFLVHKQIGP